MKKTVITEMTTAALSIILLIGNNTWFKVCGPKDDGSFMACHWAGRMITACAVLILVLTAAHIVFKDVKAKLALDLSIGCTAVMTLLAPGTIIGLCGDSMMMCRAHTQPWTIGLSAAIILAVCLDAFVSRSLTEGEKHKRK